MHPVARRSCDPEQLHALILEGQRGAEHPGIKRHEYTCAGCAPRTPWPRRAPFRAGMRRRCREALSVPPQPGHRRPPRPGGSAARPSAHPGADSEEGRKGPALRPVTLRDTPPPRTPRPRPGRCPVSGAPFPAWQGDAQRGGSAGWLGWRRLRVQPPPAAPSRPPRPLRAHLRASPAPGGRRGTAGAPARLPRSSTRAAILLPPPPSWAGGCGHAPWRAAPPAHARPGRPRDPLTAPQLRGEPRPRFGGTKSGFRGPYPGLGTPTQI